MAAGFGATIVPFAAVGEDDLLQLVLDRNALMKIPKLSDHLKDSSRGTVRTRDESSGELRKKKSLIQWFCPSYRDGITICLGCP
ncbi:hypothetical protein C1H46_021485 [Malus baccata]|uniref:Uncharacterized protein n=1 Tax=Malus baccata TaxID=106549 RepID=A0A540M2N0_MALBA|nr:hypothetical protein C1H46_021485 [Malus baccata]